VDRRSVGAALPAQLVGFLFNVFVLCFRFFFLMFFNHVLISNQQGWLSLQKWVNGLKRLLRRQNTSQLLYWFLDFLCGDHRYHRLHWKSLVIMQRNDATRLTADDDESLEYVFIHLFVVPHDSLLCVCVCRYFHLPFCPLVQWMIDVVAGEVLRFQKEPSIHTVLYRLLHQVIAPQFKIGSSEMFTYEWRWFELLSIISASHWCTLNTSHKIFPRLWSWAIAGEPFVLEGTQKEKISLFEGTKYNEKATQCCARTLVHRFIPLLPQTAKDEQLLKKTDAWLRNNLLLLRDQEDDIKEIHTIVHYWCQGSVVNSQTFVSLILQALSASNRDYYEYVYTSLSGEKSDIVLF
jgi:hypothetical protein